MAAFAEIENGHVVNVISVGDDDLLNSNSEREEATGIAYLKNTLGASRNFVETYTDGTVRGVMARIGFLYDSEKDIFVDPDPPPHWSELKPG
jgi:hypothetical protein